MKISLEEIQQVFNDLIKEVRSREDIASWALTRQQANDNDDLEFEPLARKAIIWKSLLYLMGVDLRDIDGSYLHSFENFIKFRKKMNF